MFNPLAFIVSAIVGILCYSQLLEALSISQRSDVINISGGCNTDRLAVYKVVLHTYWTRDLFPKHYPDWRPPAQWTKTFGMYIICYIRPYIYILNINFETKVYIIYISIFVHIKNVIYYSSILQKGYVDE